MFFRLPVIFYVLSLLLLCLAAAHLLPFMTALYYQEYMPATAFAAAALLLFFPSAITYVSLRQKIGEFELREIIILTVSAWAVIPVLAALPLWVIFPELPLLWLVFESVSGMTTTGISIFAEPETLPHSVIIWRSFLQWIGGFASLILFIIILPRLRIGGMHLFAHIKGVTSDKIIPRIKDLYMAMGGIYAGLSLAFAAGYMLTGTGFFNAVNMGMSTVATGGFMPDSQFYLSSANPDLLFMVTVCFMLCAAIPFLFYIQILAYDRFVFFKDEQIRSFLLFTICALIIYCFYIYGFRSDTYAQSLAQSIFEVISILTSTGFQADNHVILSPYKISLFLFLAYIGGCTGSTAGGMKITRLVIVAKSLLAHFKKLIFRHSIITIRYQNRTMGHEMIIDILSFMAVYVFANGILAICLALSGMTFQDSLILAASAFSNVNTGIDPVAWTDTTYLLMMVGMILGRIEILAALILFTQRFWKR